MSEDAKGAAPKLCKDCKHFKVPVYCGREWKLDLVDGHQKRRDAYIERSFDLSDFCGPSGKFYERGNNAT